MELGIHYIDFEGSPTKIGPTLAQTARTTEQAGATMFTLADHFFQMEALGRAEDPFLEGYTTLGFLAGQTETITLSLMVTGVTYRHPGVLAKTVTTLDVLSQGRSMLGIGAAWYEREHLALGIPHPPLSRRFDMLEETLQICQQMWSNDDGPYDGAAYQLAETICSPQPINSPPILIGGDGEKKTLRLVAQYADVWNSNATVAEELQHKVQVLHRHCDTLGRDPAAIRKTLMINPAELDPIGDTPGFLRAAERYAELGVELLNLAVLPGNPDPVGYVTRVCEAVVPGLASIG